VISTVLHKPEAIAATAWRTWIKMGTAVGVPETVRPSRPPGDRSKRAKHWRNAQNSQATFTASVRTGVTLKK
jgi:hypothetical protein